VTASFDGVSYSVPVNNVLIDGASAGTDANGDSEQVLDIVQAIAMAPGLQQVLVYIGPYDNFNDADIFSRMATDNIAKQISVSWAFDDEDVSTDDPIFMEMAAQGQTVFVASGDWEAYPGDFPYFPSEDPYVISVGGTDLITSGPGGSWVSETAWSDSGGGPSPDGFPIQPWQLGLANGSNDASETVRNSPDVAAQADFANYTCGSSTADSQVGCGGGWGGTSFAAPRWAGFLALANQQSVANGNSTIGNLAPVIYPLGLDSTSYADDFHDITSGNNNNGEGQSYNAVVGYDLVTGLGTPNGQNLIDALAGRLRATLLPASLSFGYQLVSTPSATQSSTYTNIGSATVNLPAVGIKGTNSADFALVDTGTSCPYGGGPVAAGASCTIDVQFTPTAAGARLAAVLAGDNSLSLSGTGTLGAGVGTLAPTSLFFVNQLVSTNAVLSARVTNTGSAAITFSSIAVGAGSAANFTLATTGTSCPYGGGSLASGAFCTIDVQFAAPAASTATLTGSILLTDNIGVFNGVLGTSTAALTQKLGLSGNAVLGTGVATLAPTTINFGNQFVNGTPVKSSLLTNTGSAPIVVNGITVTGTNLADFPLITTGTSCPYTGGTLGVGASCTIDVKFLVPASASSLLTASVVLNDNIGVLNGSLSTLTQSLPITGQASSTYPIPFVYPSLQPVAAVPGSAGFTLVVSGTGFFPTSVVEWNGNPLATTVISSRQISATVPAANVAVAGTASITVKNPAPGGGVSNGAYFVVTNPTVAVDYTNAPGSPIGPIGDGGPNVIAVADFNRDGIQDLVIGNLNPSANSSATFEILLGNGNGTFTSKATYVGSTGSFFGFITGVVPSDFNGDGIPDLAVLDWGNNVVELWQGNGDGTFTLKSTTSTGSSSGPNSAVAADFNGDGKLDLAVANTGNETISILLGNGNGAFTTGTVIQPPVSVNGLYYITAGDFNGDGQLDLGTSCFASCFIVYLGNNDGTFGSGLVTNISGDGGLGVVVAADFNGDGKLDLASPDSLGNVQVILGKGDGTFTTTTPLPAGPEPLGLTTGDFNGDGILDLAVTNSDNYPSNSSTISVMLGNGDGTFQPQVQVPAGDEPYSIATGDFYGNGRLDLAVANAAEYDGGAPTSVSVLVQPLVGLASVTPASLTFAAQTDNVPSAAQTVKLTNTGEIALTVTSVAATANFSTTTNCVTQSPLASGASCVESVIFDPTTTGTLTGSLTFTDNSGGVTGNTQTVGLSGTGNPGMVNVTVSTNPLGPAFTVDTIPYSGTKGLTWTIGTTHTFSTTTPQAGAPGTQYLFANWPDGTTNPASDTVTATAGVTSYVANFATQSLLTVSAGTGGTIAAGTAANGYYNLGSIENLVATPNAGYYFSGWTGEANTTDIASLTSASTTITMNAPESLTANFLPLPGYVVTTTADDATGNALNCPAANSPVSTNCSLRDALAATAAHGGNITFSPSTFASAQTITLGSAGTLNIPSNTSITGPVAGGSLANLVTVSGANLYTVFSVASGVTGATISNLTIANGNTAAGNGGGIDNLGVLTVNASTLSTNSACNGGAISNSGTLTVNASTLSGNYAAGYITGCGNGGGGIYNYAGTLIVNGSTFSGNSSAPGGAILVNDGTVTVNNSTFTGNSALDNKIGGAFFINNGSVTLNNSTISGNSASGGGGGGITNYGNLTMTNSILAGDNGGECYPDASSCGTNGANGNVVGVSIALAPLSNYGGSTQAMLPLPGSPAICAGTQANATAAGLTTDQRGLPRTTTYGAGVCVDAGAVETNYTSVQFASPSYSGYVNTALSPAPIVTVTESGQSIGGVPITLTFAGNGTATGLGPATTVAGTGATFSIVEVSTAGSSDSLSVSVPITASGNAVQPTPLTASAGLTIGGFTTSTVLSSSLNPSVYGQSVSVYATVTDTGGGPAPTGTVTFTVDGVAQTPVATIAGVATYTTSAFIAGPHTISAKYNGNTNTLASSSLVPFPQTVNAASTTNVVTSSSPNPSNVGTSVTFIATVTAVAPGAGLPTGSVTFTDATTNTTLGQGTLIAGATNSTASLSITTLTPGPHSISASFTSASTNFSNSTTTSPYNQTVNRYPTVTALGSSLNPSTYGQSVGFTATVTSGGSPVTTGSVTFTVDGVAGSPVALNATGQASFSTSALKGGSHTVSASYGQTATYSASTSSPALSQGVNKAAPGITWVPASIQFGYTLTSAQLNATANVAGTSFVYTPPLGTQITNTSQTLSVLFTPSDTTDYNSVSKTVPLTVTAGPLASISPTSIALGTVYLGQIITKNVTVTNVGTAAMTITGPLLSVVQGGNSDEFVEVNGCPKSLAAGKSCTISITFIAGPFYNPQTATLSIMDNSPVNPQKVALSATVIDPQASLNPTSLSFGTVTKNTTLTKSVTLTNNGATPLSNIGLSVIGTSAAEFTLTPATTCGSTLANGKSCTISVAFRPIAATSYSATLQVTDNTQSGKQTVSMSGSGH
jgi:CSLREA domain-containing protein